MYPPDKVGKPGRKPGLNKEVKTTALTMLRAGAKRHAVYQFLGVPKQTWSAWMAKGEQGIKPYRKFYEDVLKAEAHAEMRAVGSVVKAGEGDWKANAWWLERARPDHWAKQEPSPVQVNVTEVHERLRERLAALIAEKGEPDTLDEADGE